MSDRIFRFPATFLILFCVCFISSAHVAGAEQIVARLDTVKKHDVVSSHLREDMDLPESGQFTIPRGFENRVRFWVGVYSKWTTSQAILHDKNDINVVYAVLDLDKVFKTKPSRRAIRRYVSKKKREIQHALRRLYKTGKPKNELQRRLVSKWAFKSGKKKFRNAARNIRMQLGQADRFRKGIIRSGKYMVHMRKIFRSAGLPEELCALPHVESSFNYKAYSSAGASGVWQFTRSTGRLFMKVNHIVDQRNDPIASTYAASKLLAQNYATLNSWPLALTAYNHGLGGMKRAKRKLGTSIVTITKKYRSRSFGFASKNFYAEFLAALHVSQNYRKYFGILPIEQVEYFDTVKLGSYVSAKILSKNLGYDLETLKRYNPDLGKGIWRGHWYIPRGHELKVPYGDRETVIAKLASLPGRHSHTGQKRSGHHIVRRGQNLHIIAKLYKTNVRTLKSLNGLRGSTIYAGQKLKLPSSSKKVKRRKSKPVVRQVYANGATHTIKKGESLNSIAKIYGTSVRKIKNINNLRGSRIYPGQRLKLPLQNNSGTKLASASRVAGKVETQKVSVKKVSIAVEPVPANNAPAPLAKEADNKNQREESVMPDLLPSDFGVEIDAKGTGNIVVQAEENLALYAEWLMVPRRTIQKLNRRNLHSKMQLGASVKIPLTKATVDDFVARRIAFQEKLANKFLGRHRVSEELDIQIGRGDSLWNIVVNRHGTPLWLVRRYNPGVRLARLQPGDKIIVPKTARR